MNKELRFFFDLDCKIAIYVPSTTDVNCADKENLQEVFMDKCMRKFSEWFGGATATDALGGWMSNDKGLILERVRIVYAFCRKEDFAENFTEILQICEEIKSEMRQESVTLEYNGQIKFV